MDAFQEKVQPTLQLQLRPARQCEWIASSSSGAPRNRSHHSRTVASCHGWRNIPITLIDPLRNVLRDFISSLATTLTNGMLRKAMMNAEVAHV
jgi:hypothetical protein